MNTDRAGRACTCLSQFVSPPTLPQEQSGLQRQEGCGPGEREWSGVVTQRGWAAVWAAGPVQRLGGVSKKYGGFSEANPHDSFQVFLEEK